MQYNQYSFYIFNQDALKNCAYQEAQSHYNEQQKYIAEIKKQLMILLMHQRRLRRIIRKVQWMHA